MDKIKAHPDLVELGVTEALTMIDGVDRRIIAYPCRNKTLLNFVVCLRGYHSPEDPSRADFLGSR